MNEVSIGSTPEAKKSVAAGFRSSGLVACLVDCLVAVVLTGCASGATPTAPELAPVFALTLDPDEVEICGPDELSIRYALTYQESGESNAEPIWVCVSTSQDLRLGAFGSSTVSFDGVTCIRDGTMRPGETWTWRRSLRIHQTYASVRELRSGHPQIARLLSGKQYGPLELNAKIYLFAEPAPGGRRLGRRRARRKHRARHALEGSGPTVAVCACTEENAP